MRADQLLVERGLAASRSQAARLIASGLRWRSRTDGAWRAVGKNGELIPPDAQLELTDDAEARYVSRGGLKLAGALEATGQAVVGLRCLDVGQSTGGFTDCLLQLGAAQVVGVDVGHGQLHTRLRTDARVRVFEGVNGRQLTLAQLTLDPTQGPPRTALDEPAARPPLKADDARFDLIVGDLSFISLTLVLPALPALLRPSGALLLLVKPQFELQPDAIGKGGIVKDPALYTQVEQRLRAACAEQHLLVRQWLPSGITGGDGNREFFVWASPATTPQEKA